MVNRTSEEEWTVRTATRDDLDEIFDVYAAVASERVHIGAEPPIDRAKRLRKWAALLDTPNEVMFVAGAAERIVGFAAVTWAGASEIGMAILPEWRGRGIGGALLDHLIEWAEEHGSHKMELYVWPHNEAAIALYEKYGFESEGYLRRHYRRANGELWDCVIMGLQLPRSP